MFLLRNNVKEFFIQKFVAYFIAVKAITLFHVTNLFSTSNDIKDQHTVFVLICISP